jgi:small subunit ribosomal protein S6
LRHYEIMLLIHPDQSERARVMMDRYAGIIEGGQGQVHRREDLGRRMLAYPIAKVQKAHYMLMNLECGQETLDELVGALHFSDAVLRHLVVRRDEAISDQSVLAKAVEKEAARENREFPYDRELAHGRRSERGDEGAAEATADTTDTRAEGDAPEAAAEVAEAAADGEGPDAAEGDAPAEEDAPQAAVEVAAAPAEEDGPDTAVAGEEVAADDAPGTEPEEESTDTPEAEEEPSDAADTDDESKEQKE